MHNPITKLTEWNEQLYAYGNSFLKIEYELDIPELAGILCVQTIFSVKKLIYFSIILF